MRASVRGPSSLSVSNRPPRWRPRRGPRVNPVALPAVMPRVIVAMGVTGSGKSTVGAGLAVRLGIDFTDGDDLHPPENVTKMSRGEALTDADRWPWLSRVAAVLADRAAHPAGIVVACSALRRRYRDHIRAHANNPKLLFVFLDVSPEVATARLHARPGHFMPASLVDSQFATLERPDRDETDVVSVGHAPTFAETVARAAAAARARDDV